MKQQRGAPEQRPAQPGVDVVEEPRSAPKCPHCGIHDAIVISLFGTQAISLQYRCRQCGALYEAIRYH
jgi:predicted RNA-binding Zn-ribbon protein involved in translation (DUF1610 family)